MDEIKRLEARVARLQRRVTFLTCVIAVAAPAAGVLAVQAWDGSEAKAQAPRIFEADVIRASQIVVRSSDARSSTVLLTAGKAGGGLVLSDADGNQQVRLRARGLTLQDPHGGHSLHLGLSPGPGDLSPPFIALRNRSQKDALTLSLGADDLPRVRLDHKAGEELAVLELAPKLLYLSADNDAARAVLRISRDRVPQLLLNQSQDQKEKQEVIITPATVLPPEHSERKE